MNRPYVLVGDKTSHGGCVLQGATATDSGGRPIARVGDAVSCPRKGHGKLGVIVSGDPSLLIDGRPAARDGDRTSCGAVLIASQRSTTD